MNNLKLNEKLMVDAGGGGGASSQEKKFDYAQVDAAMTSLSNSIQAIATALSKKITVTSYTGSAQGSVESAMNSIRTNLQTINEPLNEMNNKIQEISQEYASREAKIQSELANIAGAGTSSNMTM